MSIVIAIFIQITYKNGNYKKKQSGETILYPLIFYN